MLNKVRIVLVGTSHPGNIGAAARAMHNMGLSDLCLVAPRAQFPHPEADLRSAGATQILAAATVVNSLEEAVAGATLVAGASARSRHLPWPLSTPRQLASQAIAELTAPKHKLALVFGREDRGLSNAELQLCQWHVHIPCNPNFSSLNLGAAVQVVAYELYQAYLQHSDLCPEDSQPEKLLFGTPWDAPLAQQADLERMFSHLEQTLVAINFLDPHNPKQLMQRLRRLLLRARPDEQEVQLLRGWLSQTQKTLNSVANSSRSSSSKPN